MVTSFHHGHSPPLTDMEDTMRTEPTHRMFPRALRAPFMLCAILAFALLAGSGDAQAKDKRHGFDGPSMQSGGFNGPGPEAVSVAQALKLGDDQRAVLRGNIIRHLGGKHYEFSDGTGTITAEIEPHQWNGQSITPTDLVELYGKIDRDWMELEFDVKRIIKQ